MSTINTELEHICTWFIAKKLSGNLKKSNYILFGSKPRFNDSSLHAVLLNGTILERVTYTKFLGILIDQNLDWKQHTSHIALKVSKSLGILNRIKALLSTELLKTLYYTMIHPYFVYCILIWGGASKLAINKLSCLQKRAVRILTHSNFRAHTNPLFLRLQILKLPDLYHLQLGIFMFKAKYHLLPSSSSHHIQFTKINPRFDFRKKFDFQPLVFKTQIRYRYIGITGSKFWNALPLDIVNLRTLLSLKKRFKMYLIEPYGIEIPWKTRIFFFKCIFYGDDHVRLWCMRHHSYLIVNFFLRYCMLCFLFLFFSYKLRLYFRPIVWLLT